MIVSKYGKSYDTADGSEQSFGRQLRRAAQGDGKAPDQRWEDDGGPLKAEGGDAAAAAGATEGPPPRDQFLTKPTWSVRSLRDLNEAVRLQQWPDNPAHAVRAASEAERRRLQAIDVAAERAASAAHAQMHRDRNPWEHT
jgi:hypothetical protein